MFALNKRLQYTVRASQPKPGPANLMLEQFGGPQGDMAAACRYFSQAPGDDDTGRKDMLLDIATEELSHQEVIGNIDIMLNKGHGAAHHVRSGRRAGDRRRAGRAQPLQQDGMVPPAAS